MFVLENENGLIYMRSDIIPLKHAFTTRYGGVSTGHLESLNLISNHGDEPENIRENFRRVAALFGVSRGAMLLALLFLLVPLMLTAIPLDAFRELLSASTLARHFMNTSFFTGIYFS